MRFYIAQFKALHKVMQFEQHSVFIWKQDSTEIDLEMLQNKIARESSIHFYSLIGGKNYQISLEDIMVTIEKAEAFNGWKGTMYITLQA